MVKSNASPARAPRTLDQLFAAGVDSFDACLESKLALQAKCELRDAYLLEMFARRVCDDDYMQAAQVIDTKIALLDERSPREVARTDAGLIEIRRMLDEGSWRRRFRGVAAFVHASLDHRERELRLLLDLLPLAWGFDDDEFAQLLGVTSDWLQRWRATPIKISEELAQRLRRLQEFHEAMRKVIVPSQYASVWRRTWPSGSAIGERTPWQAFLDDGDQALDCIENFIFAAAEAMSS